MTTFQGVFNVTQGIAGSNAVFPGQSATTNTTNLQTLVNTLLDPSGPTQGQGGTLQFPSAGVYQFNGAITVGRDLSGGTEPYNIIFMGTGQGKLSKPILQQIGSADLFIVDDNTGSDEDIGGTVFQDLMLSYDAATEVAGNAAVHVKGASESVRLYRVTTLNWPTAVLLANSYRATLIDCTLHITSAVSTYGGIGVQIGDAGSSAAAIETYIAGCLFLDSSNLGIGVQVYGCEHLRLVNTRIEGWQQGILVSPTAESGSAKELYFGNVSCFPYSSVTATGAAVLIETSGGTSTAPRYVAQVWFDCCEFSGPASQTFYTGGGVVIQPGSGNYNPIDQVRFVDCHVTLWNGPGLNITGGTNIEVLGGCYSCNGVKAVPNRAGIAVTGAASGVRMSGAACNNSVYDFSLSPPAFATATQNYGISVAAGATNIRINNCDLTGNLNNGLYVTGSSAAPVNVFVDHCDFTGLSSPVHVVTPVTNLQITNCPGYNDQATVLQSTTPPPANPITNTTFGWYGSLAFYVKGAGHVTIDGTDTALTDGGYTLSPGESAGIAGASGATNFLAIGR